MDIFERKEVSLPKLTRLQTIKFTQLLRVK
jgi:hypothetical protein